MDNKLINIIDKHLISIFGKIKVKDITFINDPKILNDHQNSILKIIKNNINRKIIQKSIELCDSYNSNVNWIFDKKTSIKHISIKKKQNKNKIICGIIGIIVFITIMLFLYNKELYIPMGILFVALVSIIGFIIAYQKMHLFNKKVTKVDKEKSIIENNTTDFINLFAIIQEIYDYDIFLKHKKYIRDTLQILKNIVTKPDGLIKINSNKDKYSKMLTKLLEYIGMIDVYLAIVKLIQYDNYVLPEYVDTDVYLEFTGDSYIKFDNNLRIMYVTGNYQKRSEFIDELIFNIYSCQTIGICNYFKIKYTPFTAIIDKEINDIYSVIELLDDKNNVNNKYLIILTLTIEMNHYFIELLRKLINYKNIILILSFDDVIKDLEIDKYIIKQF